LQSEDQARLARNQCIKNCRQLLEEAESRFNLELDVLQTALVWDDGSRLWTEMNKRASETQPNRAEPYFATAFPWQLAIELNRDGKRELVAEMLETLGKNSPPPAAKLDILAAEADKAGVNDLVRAMETVPVTEKADREWAVLFRVNDLIRAGKIAEAVSFVRLFKDHVLKEEVLLWTAAQACRADHRRPTKKILEEATFIPTETVSAWRGYLLALSAFDHDAH